MPSPVTRLRQSATTLNESPQSLRALATEARKPFSSPDDPASTTVDALRETQAQGSPFHSMNAAHSGEPGALEAGVKRFQGTLLGVAQPGIAPTYDHPPPAPPNALNPIGTAPTEPPPPGPSGVPFDAVPHRQDLPVAPRPAWQTAAMIGAGLCIAAGFGGLMAKMGKPDLKVTVTRFAVDDAGQDQLELSCDECADGTSLRILDATARFENKKGTLLLSKPLALGQNQFELAVVGPDGSIISAEPLMVPVAFRMSSNWKGRTATPPFGQVLVEAPSGSAIKIDGKPADAPAGKAEYAVVIDTQSLGESKETQRVALDIPIEVSSGDKLRQTRASLRSGIAPLYLTSIGPVHQLGGKPVTIAGVSTPGARIRFGEAQTQANERGEFSLVLSSPQELDGFIIAEADDLLSRRVPLKLTRSSPSSPSKLKDFSQVTEPTFVSLTATLIESRVQQGVTRSLLEVQNGCTSPPCLVSATYAEPRHLVPNRSIELSGWATPGDPLNLRVSKFR